MSAERPGEAEESVLRYEIVVSRLPREGLEVRYEADADERTALAAFLDILSVDVLEANVVVAPWRRDGVSVRGRLLTRLTQASVVTLDPVPEEIDEVVDLVFLPEGSRLNRPRRSDEGEIVLDPEGDDIPETFTGDRIDLGAALMELVALGLDPYPRGEAAGFEALGGEPDPVSDERPSPFAALARLKREGG